MLTTAGTPEIVETSGTGVDNNRRGASKSRDASTSGTLAAAAETTGTSQTTLPAGKQATAGAPGGLQKHQQQ
jgi:hypothetical protein